MDHAKPLEVMVERAMDSTGGQKQHDTRPPNETWGMQTPNAPHKLRRAGVNVSPGRAGIDP